MKKLFIVLLALFLLGGCTAPKKVEEKSQDLTLANPFKDYEDLKSAAAAADVKANLPATIADYRIDKYRAIKGELLEVIYTQADKSLTYRQSKGTENNSGVWQNEAFTTYDFHDLTINYLTKADLITLAYWTKDQQSYSIVADEGIKQTELESLIETLLTA